MDILQKSAAQGSAAPHRVRAWGRFRRWRRRIGIVLLAALAALGGLSIYRSLAGPPGVGHFRSAEGREEYLIHYREAMGQMPEPSATHDIATSYGIVRVYEWNTPETADSTPVVLVPGRSSGVPM